MQGVLWFRDVTEIVFCVYLELLLDRHAGSIKDSNHQNSKVEHGGDLGLC